MEENILSWNLPNWITVVLMATVGFAAVAALASFIRPRMNQGGGDSGDASGG